MIVLAIIGIVVAMSLFGLQKARENTRDAKRKSDLESVRSALELYKADNGGYPGTGGTTVFWQLTNGNAVGKALIGVGGTSLSYIATIPQDPRDSGANILCDTGDTNFGYEYASDTLKYITRTKMENQSSSNCPLVQYGCSSWTACYLVTQP